MAVTTQSFATAFRRLSYIALAVAATVGHAGPDSGASWSAPDAGQAAGDRHRHRLGQRPAGAALRQPQVRPGQCARRPRTGTTTCAGSIRGPACRSRSPPSSRTGGASATGRGPRAGCITRCCRAGAPRWWCRPRRTIWCRFTSGGRQIGGSRPPAIGRARRAQILQRHLVPVRGQEFRRLDQAGSPLGRLSEREGGLSKLRRRHPRKRMIR